MKLHKVLCLIVLMVLLLRLHGQNNVIKNYHVESIIIDSIHIESSKFSVNLNKFYKKNKKNIKPNSFIYIDMNKYYNKDTNSYIVIIKLENDMDNALTKCLYGNMGYCMLNNVYVLILFSKDMDNLFFKRTQYQRNFIFNRRDTVKTTVGVNSTRVGYKVKKRKNNEFLIRRIFYFKYPSSGLKKIYYRVFFNKHY